MGDSITEGWHVEKLRAITSQLDGLLPGTPEIFNLGVSGMTMALQASSTYPTYAEPLFTADYGSGRCILVIQSGTNDIAIGGADAETLQDTATALVADAQAAGFKVALVTLLPYSTWAAFDPTREGYRTTYNAWVMAGSSGADFVIDAASASGVTYIEGVNGVHPDGAGYEVLATTRYGPALTAELETLDSIVFEGDSITFNGSSWAYQWAAAHPSVAYENFAVSGSGIATMQGRISQVIDAAPNVLAFLIGTNDLLGYSTAADFVAEIFDYIADVRAGVPGIKVFVGTVLPVDPSLLSGSYAAHNAKRHDANALLRAAVGNQIDAIIPFGTHPRLSRDEAPAELVYWNDGVHPGGVEGIPIMGAIAAAVLDPFFAGTTGTAPDFAFTDTNNAELSTLLQQEIIVTGLGKGNDVAASSTGSGVFAVGLDAAAEIDDFGTSASGIMNGDVITSELTSSASNDTPLNHALTVGSTTDTWTVRTKLAVPPDLVIGDLYGLDLNFSSGSFTFTGVEFGEGCALVGFDVNGAANVTSCEIQESDGTPVATLSVVEGSGMPRSAWVSLTEIPAAVDYKIVGTCAAAIDLINARTATLTELSSIAVEGGATLGLGFRNPGNYLADAEVVVPSGGIGFAYVYSLASPYTLSNSGTSLVGSYGDDWYLWKFTTTGTPAHSSIDDGVSGIVAGSVGQA
ncbi:MAG: SGNH/GDSL hydrolase family protein [Candidatus Moraniibacteriota bacterium]